MHWLGISSLIMLQMHVEDCVGQGHGRHACSKALFAESVLLEVDLGASHMTPSSISYVLPFAISFKLGLSRTLVQEVSRDGCQSCVNYLFRLTNQL